MGIPAAESRVVNGYCQSGNYRKIRADRAMCYVENPNTQYTTLFNRMGSWHRVCGFRAGLAVGYA